MSGPGVRGGTQRILDAWFSAFNEHDLDGLCRLADPGIELVPIEQALTAPPGTTYRGHAGLRSLMAPGFERFPQMQLDPGPVRDVAGRVVVEMDFLLDDGKEKPQMRRAACVYGLVGSQLSYVHAFDRSAGAFGDEVWRRDWERASRLTPREREVLTMQADGQTVSEIAEQLVLSQLTVRTHVRNAKEKLGARTNAHAVAIVLRAHLFTD
jgi:DNA-binding CsgD family transcriptional regulator